MDARQDSLPSFETRPSKSAVADFDTLDRRSRASPTSVGAPSTKVKTKFPPGSTMENRLSSAVVGPAGGQLRMRLSYLTRLKARTSNHVISLLLGRRRCVLGLL